MIIELISRTQYPQYPVTLTLTLEISKSCIIYILLVTELFV